MKKIDLCSGYNHPEGFITLDIRPECNPDIVCDIEKGLPFKNGEIEYVRAFDALEHFVTNKIQFVMEEIYRVLVINGTFELFVPSTDYRGAFQDFTHKSFWNSNSLWYFMKDEYIRLYNTKAKFEGQVKNVLTDPINRIGHVYSKLKKVPM